MQAIFTFGVYWRTNFTGLNGVITELEEDGLNEVWLHPLNILRITSIILKI